MKEFPSDVDKRVRKTTQTRNRHEQEALQARLDSISTPEGLIEYVIERAGVLFRKGKPVQFTFKLPTQNFAMWSGLGDANGQLSGIDRNQLRNEVTVALRNGLDAKVNGYVEVTSEPGHRGDNLVFSVHMTTLGLL